MRFIDNWYNISVLFAGVVFVVIGVGDFDARATMILASTGLIFMHFFEEFGFPGGFPWIGLHVEMGITDTNTKSWSLNSLNSMIGNWWFILAVYVPALIFPQATFLLVAVGVMAVLEVLMHLIGFNVGLRSWYNPGLATAIMLIVVALPYFVPAIAAGTFGWLDLLFGVVWVVFNYWLVFRSPLYKWLGTKTRFAFPEQEVLKASKYIDAFRAREQKKKAG